MTKIIGRHLEQAYLKEAIDSDKSELIALYGRRRIGKTYLIREYYKKNLVFEISGLFGGSLKDQLQNFDKELNNRTKSLGLENINLLFCILLMNALEMERELLINLLRGSDISKISFTKAKTIFNYLLNDLDIYCGAEIKPNRTITRVRVHLDNEEFFYNEKDLSYHPNGENILKYSRCALPFYSMFYGAIDFDKHNNLKIKNSIEAKRLLIGTPIFESGLGHHVLNSGKPIRFSIGYWELKKPLDAILVVFNEKAKIFENHLKEEKESFRQIIEMDKKPQKEYIFKFLEFISEEFAKPVKSHEEYKFSALYSTKVLLENGKDAIIYPSVKTETEGLCIAIKPNIIEEKCSFSLVEVCEAQQTGENQVSIKPIFVGKTSEEDVLNTNIIYSEMLMS